MTNFKFSAGDRVRYATKFLRGIKATLGDLAFMRGTVTQVRKVGRNVLVSVRWDSDEEASAVLERNLERSR